MINKSICSYPFTHSYIGPKYDRKLCCMSGTLNESDKVPIKDWWNNEQMQEVRRKMLAGEKVDQCAICYLNEGAGIRSWREDSFDLMPEEIVATLSPIVAENPIYYDYRTIHCNLQCVSCMADYSSQHIALAKDLHGKIDPFKVDPVYEETMKTEILESLRNRTCKKIYWAGGEPMMSPVHWAVIEEMNQIQKIDPDYISSIAVHYNTNLTRLHWKKQDIPAMLEFYQPKIFASMDGTHETFEFVRDGAKWDLVSDNWKRYYEKLNKHNQFGISTVLTAPVIFDIDRWFDFYEPYDPELFNYRLVTNKMDILNIDHGFLDIRLFPEEIVDKAISHAIMRFEKSNLRNKENTIAILQTYIDQRKEFQSLFDDTSKLNRLKQNVEKRDKFLISGRSLAELLSIINADAYKWYKEL
jgi:sulfatase maturation enzyme AslB (radical SAM superfamily)